MDDVVGPGCDENCTTLTETVRDGGGGGDAGAGVWVTVVLSLCVPCVVFGVWWWRRRYHPAPDDMLPAEEKQLVVVDVDEGIEGPIWDGVRELTLTQTASELTLREVTAVERRMERLLRLLPDTPLPPLGVQMGGSLISPATHHLLRDPTTADSLLTELTTNLYYPHQTKMQSTQILYLLASKLQSVYDTCDYPPVLLLGVVLYPLPGELLDALLLWEDGEPHNEAIYTTWGRWPSLVTVMAAYAISHPAMPIVVSCDTAETAQKDPAQRVYVPSPVVCTTAEITESSLSAVTTSYLHVPGTELVILPPLTTLVIDSRHQSQAGVLFYEATIATVPLSPLMETSLAALEADTTRFESMRGADTFIFDI